MNTSDFKKKAFILVFMLIGITACIASVEDYKFLSFEKVMNARVVKWVEEGVGGIKLKMKIPIEYEIPRDNYTIKVTLPKSRTGASVILNVIGKTSSQYYIEGDSIYGPKKQEELPYRYFYISPRNTQAGEIVFSVKDSNGKIVAKEVLKYDVIVAGSYVDIDGI